MTTKKTKRIRFAGRILAMVMAFCLIFSMAITASAAAASGLDGVKNGVLKFNWLYDGEAFSRGSCFLINDTTVVTAYHCTMFSSSEMEAYGITGKAAEELKSHMSYSVTVERDMTVKAKLIIASEEMDFAIFSLEQSIPTRQYLTLRNSSDVKAAETVYSVGFPSNSDIGKTINTYTTDDVTYKTGVVSKAESIYEYYTREGFHFNGKALQTSCVLSGGDSGGPMVDEQGYVVGVSVASSDYYYAVAIDQIISACENYSIAYSMKGAVPVSEPNTDSDTLDTSELSNLIARAQVKLAEDYTEDSYSALEDALDDANNALSAETQEEIDAATDELNSAINGLVEVKKTSAVDKYATIGIIAVVAVIVIGVGVVLIIVLTKKKKPAAVAPAPGYAQPPVQSQVPVNAAPAPQRPPVQTATPVRPAAPVSAPAPVATPASAETTVLNQSAGETTVLSANAGETTVLSQAVNGGVLVRTSNNERIPITSAEFTVGRERSSVDYCVGGNTNISRVHARFIVRDGVTYIVDNKAANGTFVNGVKARAGQEVALNNGDKIVLADEKFEYSK